MKIVILQHKQDEALNVARKGATYEVSGEYILVKTVTDKDPNDAFEYGSNEVVEIFNLSDYDRINYI